MLQFSLAVAVQLAVLGHWRVPTFYVELRWAFGPLRDQIGLSTSCPVQYGSKTSS